jgi:hypothetical protein
VLGFVHPEYGQQFATDEFVQALAASHNDAVRREIGLGECKPRFSRTLDGSYWSQGCSSCDALFGEYLLYEAFVEVAGEGASTELGWPHPALVPSSVLRFDEPDEPDDDGW